jgi:hypothetical protein
MVFNIIVPSKPEVSQVISLFCSVLLIKILYVFLIFTYVLHVPPNSFSLIIIISVLFCFLCRYFEREWQKKRIFNYLGYVGYVGGKYNDVF